MQRVKRRVLYESYAAVIMRNGRKIHRVYAIIGNDFRQAFHEFWPQIANLAKLLKCVN